MKHALITTTIHVPRNLDAYARDIANHGPADTTIVVSGDRKTPPETAAFLDQLSAKYGVPCVYLSPAEQDRLFPAYSGWLPWNCIQRRNTAILHAYQNGAEVIATIDDDNYWEEESYFQQHGELGTLHHVVAYETRTGWFNPCAVLVEQRHQHFYPRGYSFSMRSAPPNAGSRVRHKEGRHVVNAGLWIGEPDIDVVTRIALAPNVLRYEADSELTLGIGTKCPFNSQNTALHRDVIPAYCMLPGVGRYDDIIPSYFVKRIADHLGDYIRFGAPIVRQERNQHDLWKDLEDEKLGMQLTDRIVDRLYEIPLTARTYRECLPELLAGFDAMEDGSLRPAQREFFRTIVRGYREWTKAL